MPAIHTDEYLTTHEPRINLPPLGYLTVPAVREAAETFLRLVRERADARAAVDRAERAVLDAQSADQQALADALLDGRQEPRARRTTKAEASVVEARSRRDAFDRAVSMAHARLRDAVVANADEWRATVAADQADAASRYAAAAAELTRAHRDLVSLGGVATMLRDHPASLTAGSWRPAVELSLVAQPLADALAVVRADAHANVALPATAEDDDEDDG